MRGARSITVANADLAATLDNRLQDPQVRRAQLVASFAAWRSERVLARHDVPGTEIEDARYTQAKWAPWHDLTTQEEGCGQWQCYAPVDAFVLQMLTRVRQMRKR